MNTLHRQTPNATVLKRPYCGAVLCCLLLLLSVAALAAETYAVDPATGFRMERYRAPVPATFPGGTTLDTDALRTLISSDSPVMVDVYPPRGLGPDPLSGHWITTEIRQSLPGAIWLPEVGRGFIDENHTSYFQRNLQRLTEDDKDRAIVFFCTADCWQSWNAAKRASDWGYTAVYWFPDGSDGWVESGLEVVATAPVNFIDDTTPFSYPPTASIFLIDQQGKELAIGTVKFNPGDGGAVGLQVSVDAPEFTDQFLSMRPFRCLEGVPEWFCYLPYPYKLHNTITDDDLSDLEYQLLFIKKSPKEFGIDAWNGLYYQLTLSEQGVIMGELLEGDLNVLQTPPDDYAKPIDHNEFFADEAVNRRFPRLVIRP